MYSEPTNITMSSDEYQILAMTPLMERSRVLSIKNQEELLMCVNPQKSPHCILKNALDSDPMPN